MALPHLVKPGVNGYLYPPGDIATLATQVVAILTIPPAIAMLVYLLRTPPVAERKARAERRRELREETPLPPPPVSEEPSAG